MNENEVKHLDPANRVKHLDLDVLDRQEASERPTVTVGGSVYTMKGNYDFTAMETIRLEVRLKSLMKVDTDDETAIIQWFEHLTSTLSELFVDDVSGVDWERLGFQRIAKLIDFFVSALKAD